MYFLLALFLFFYYQFLFNSVIALLFMPLYFKGYSFPLLASSSQDDIKIDIKIAYSCTAWYVFPACCKNHIWLGVWKFALFSHIEHRRLKTRILADLLVRKSSHTCYNIPIIYLVSFTLCDTCLCAKFNR